MLEKIGLPAKPSLRGNNWVVDSSNCQSCSSQFTFINRKHHCRRCGGLFCNSCTSQRMVLRLQGDSPVRICDPCKKLEEAARFELRYGKNRPAKGGSKISNQDSASSSNIEHGNTQDYASEIVRSLSVDTSLMEVGSTTPEKLRQQSLEEKNNHKILKAQGKNQEALKAFKKAKELERQAAALELQLRKNRKQTSLSSTSIRNDQNDPAESLKKIKKDDLGDELRELGWSDMDLHEDNDKKPVNVSLEGELVNLLGENFKKPNKIDKSEVLAHKKRALTLKREGNLAEAKEELKKAKILEKKIEEQEFMIDDEDSDDEFASLIRSLDIDKQDVMSVGKNLQDSSNFSFDQINDDVDGNFDVTDDDLYDPEMTAALESMGWIEDKSDEIVDREAILSEIQSLKREAVRKKRAGDTAEAMKLFKKAKALEKEIGNDDVSPEITQIVAPKSKSSLQKELLALKKRALGLRREGKFEEAEEELRKGKVLEDQLEEFDTVSKEKVVPMIVDKHDNIDVGNDEEDAEVTDQDLNDPAYTSLLQNLGWNDENDKIESPPKVQIRRSKGEIQRELLGLKRKSLALRRQGEVEEAEKLLETAKELETQLAEMEAPKQEVEIVKEHPKETLKEPPRQEVENVKEHVKEPTEYSDTQMPDTYESSNSSQISVKQEILGHKRKAISLKREGKLAEAKDELRQAKILEKSLENQNSPEPKTEPKVLEKSLENQNSPEPKAKPIVIPEPVVQKPKVSSRDRFKIQQESLSHKRAALKFRREGKMAEAEAESELAKALESQLDEMNGQDSTKSELGDDLAGVEDFLDPQLLSALKAVGIENSSGSSQGPVVKVEKSIDERSQLEEEIKAEKVKAVNFKRSGKQADALSALRRAKLLEKKLNSLTS